MPYPVSEQAGPVRVGEPFRVYAVQKSAGLGQLFRLPYEQQRPRQRHPRLQPKPRPAEANHPRRALQQLPDGAVLLGESQMVTGVAQRCGEVEPKLFGQGAKHLRVQQQVKQARPQR